MLQRNLQKYKHRSWSRISKNSKTDIKLDVSATVSRRVRSKAVDEVSVYLEVKFIHATLALPQPLTSLKLK